METVEIKTLQKEFGCSLQEAYDRLFKRDLIIEVKSVENIDQVKQILLVLINKLI